MARRPTWQRDVVVARGVVFAERAREMAPLVLLAALLHHARRRARHIRCACADHHKNCASHGGRASGRTKDRFQAVTGVGPTRRAQGAACARRSRRRVDRRSHRHHRDDDRDRRHRARGRDEALRDQPTESRARQGRRSLAPRRLADGASRQARRLRARGRAARTDRRPLFVQRKVPGRPSRATTSSSARSPATALKLFTLEVTHRAEALGTWRLRRAAGAGRNCRQGARRRAARPHAGADRLEVGNRSSSCGT